MFFQKINEFLEVFEFFCKFLKFLELLGPAWTCSDAFGWVWMRLDAFGSTRTRSENFGKNRSTNQFFRTFGEVFEELRKNGRHRQVPCHFLLRIHLFGARYDPWSSSWHSLPSWDGLREPDWPAPRALPGSRERGDFGTLGIITPNVPK